MGEPPESDKPQRENFSVEVPSALRLKLLEAFEKRYKKPGKSRARTGEFLTHWAIQLRTDAPSDQALLNVLKGQRDTAKLWLQEGLTKIILDTVSREPGSLPLLEFALKLLWEKQMMANSPMLPTRRLAESKKLWLIMLSMCIKS
jgi:hypothetical protein